MATSRYFPILGTDFGSGSSYTSYNLSALPPNQVLGSVVESTSGKVYRLVQFDNGSGNVAAAAGAAAYWKTKASYIVTSDITDEQMGGNSFAGIFTEVATDQYYTWIQIGGIATGVSVDSGTATGDVLTAGGSTDGQLVSTNDGTAPVGIPVGVAMSNVSSGTATVSLILGNTL